ncbi:dephospho-CoA kinase [Lysobacter panacisoli]|uniref:Dephospho-CoA kinase n=2 Tax=Lysobacter panacisoli TaxID=1255263 RepID=A0ABP9L5U7_9GAMM
MRRGYHAGMSEFIIGVTGGVASGKSEVTRRFEALGIVVADADLAAREAVAPGSEGLAEVVAQFGPDVLAADGGLDRAAMRRHVFGNDAERRSLEAIIHPRVRAALRDICVAAPGAYAIAAIPLLAEGGGRDAYPWLSRILVVDVPADVQRARVMARDRVDATLAQQMVAAQATRDQRLAIADDIVVNTGAIDELDAQVAALDRRYRALAASH